MKKLIFSALSVAAIACVVLLSCKSKNDSNAITPTYKDQATGTGANPNTTQVTTTGTVATTGSANQNSSLNVGGGSWTSVGCSGQSCLTGNNTSSGTNVTICFSGVPTAGTYTLVNSNALLGPGKAVLSITNPPSQPVNTTWYSTGGTVVVTISGTSITGSFSNISCVQQSANFPVVTATGQVGCL